MPRRLDLDKKATADQRLDILNNGKWSSVKEDTSSILKSPFKNSKVFGPDNKYINVWSYIRFESQKISVAKDVGENPGGKGRKFFDEQILPLAQKTFSVYSDTEFKNSRENKVLFDSWYTQLSSDDVFERIKNGSRIAGLSEWTYSEGDTSFAKTVGQLADSWGFKDFTKEKSGRDAGVSANTISDRQFEDATEEEKKTAMEAMGGAVANAEPNKETLTVQDSLGISQCALMSDLFNKGYSYTNYPLTYGRGTDSDNKCFYGRIYPVTTSGFDPNQLVNYCTVPRNINNFFEDDSIDSNRLFWALSWVYKDAEGLKETNIFLNSSDPHNDYSGVKGLVDSSLLTLNQYASWDIQKRLNGYVFTGINIQYDGTNPATARNSVKVTMDIDLDHLSSLDTVCGYSEVVSSPRQTNSKGVITKTKKGGVVQLKIHDLVTVTQIPTVDVTTPGGEGYHLNTYTPEASRLRLKVWFDERGFRTSPSGTETGLIIDLTMIEHELARTDDAQNKTRLSITYRGYFEEALNAPYNDALATSEIILKRAGREETIKKAYQTGCSSQSIRQIKRALDETNRAESLKFSQDGGIPGRLMKENKLYAYLIDEQKYEKGRIGTRLNPAYNYVDQSSIKKLDEAMAAQAQADITALTTGSIQQDLEAYASEAAGQEGVIEERWYWWDKTGAKINRPVNYFFYLGDLIEMVTDSIYKPKSAKHYPHTEDLNMRFIIGTFKIPDPQNLSKTITINPVQIPIDYGFFIDWYNDTIVKKEISNYAFGPFIKDLLEKLVNDILYDNCFSLLALDENPPQFRTAFFTDHSTSWFKSTQTAAGQVATSEGTTDLIKHYFDPDYPLGLSKGKQNILIKKNVFSPVGQSKNYCVIYQQFPSYFRQVRSSGGRSLRSQPTTITMMDGFNNKAKNFCSGISFAKANSNSYQREALYFGSNNAGSLALMNNVYDLNFKIQTKKMNTFLYPGNIINFIVTDFAGNQWAGGNLGESDPHTRGTKANILGYGGYYIITRVEYNLSIIQSEASAILLINTKFLGTDAHYSASKETETDSFADDPAECSTIYNSQVDELRVYDIDSASTFTRASAAGQGVANNSELPSTPGEEAARVQTEAAEASRVALTNTILGPIVGYAKIGTYDVYFNDSAPKAMIQIITYASQYLPDGNVDKIDVEIRSSNVAPYITKTATLQRISVNEESPSDPFKQSYTLSYEGGICTVIDGNFTSPSE